MACWTACAATTPACVRSGLVTRAKSLRPWAKMPPAAPNPARAVDDACDRRLDAAACRLSIEAANPGTRAPVCGGRWPASAASAAVGESTVIRTSSSGKVFWLHADGDGGNWIGTSCSGSGSGSGSGSVSGSEFKGMSLQFDVEGDGGICSSGSGWRSLVRSISMNSSEPVASSFGRGWRVRSISMYSSVSLSDLKTCPAPEVLAMSVGCVPALLRGRRSLVVSSSTSLPSPKTCPWPEVLAMSVGCMPILGPGIGPGGVEAGGKFEAPAWAIPLKKSGGAVPSCIR